MAKPVFQPFTPEVLFSPHGIEQWTFFSLPLKIYLTLWRIESLLTA